MNYIGVQLLQNSMDAPKVIGSFPCKKCLVEGRHLSRTILSYTQTYERCK
ncbi:TPA_asm: hypothetical protein G4O55_002656 [Salmonella enterica subsp. enterica serovar Typhimurium]|nr:hypothetical protein [Salmonella enterica]HAE7181939.1 hypothetical protein [Salmonella enterica subsp. enterica serovar Typhimurium]